MISVSRQTLATLADTSVQNRDASLLDAVVHTSVELSHIQIAPSQRRSRSVVGIRRPSERRPSLFQKNLSGGQAIVEPEGNQALGYRAAKRVLDIAGALFLLAVLSPFLLTTLVVLLLTTRGKPIFRQVRLGYLGRPFTMYKFRTMALDADRRQHHVANEKDGPIFKNRRDPRITRFGRLLRMTSLDETPQLFNVLLGQMSLVGPRPPVIKEVAQYKPWQRRRLAVMPGLTCLWQVSGRSEIGFEDWVRMDLWYVRNQTLLTDLSLLVRTPWSVLTGRGAY
ncbi:MAG: sugar transferase [Pirellulales bacterium]|nr:sugar transferase [Pirellulales bacterium]